MYEAAGLLKRRDDGGHYDTFRNRLARQAALSRAYRSGHGYSLAQFDLAPDTLDAGLAEIYLRLRGRALPLPPASPESPVGQTPADGGTLGATLATEPALPC